MRRRYALPDEGQPDASGETEGEAVTCWECDGTGYSYGTCPTCGGFGWLRRPDEPPRPTDAKSPRKP